MVKNLPAKQGTWVQSLGQEGPLEEEMATHSSIFAWDIPWTEEPGELQSMGSQKSWLQLMTSKQQVYVWHQMELVILNWTVLHLLSVSGLCF